MNFFFLLVSDWSFIVIVGSNRDILTGNISGDKA